MIKGCFGCVFDLIKIGLGGLVIIFGIKHFSSKTNLITIKSVMTGIDIQQLKEKK